jgi:hypothetical protein
MLLTTTSTLEGQQIRYLGIVSGEAILGANVFRDFFAKITDIVGGRSGSYEAELRKAKTIAMDEMKEQARRTGGQCGDRHRPGLRDDPGGFGRDDVDGVGVGHGGGGGLAETWRAVGGTRRKWDVPEDDAFAVVWAGGM